MPRILTFFFILLRLYKFILVTLPIEIFGCNIEAFQAYNFKIANRDRLLKGLGNQNNIFKRRGNEKNNN